VLSVKRDEVIYCVLDTMYAKARYSVLQQAMHIHPTVSELIPTLLEELVPSGHNRVGHSSVFRSRYRG